MNENEAPNPLALPSGTGGVIWISGYSSAGKTTVGRIVRSELDRRGVQTVFLDGDELRSIFAHRWGYERAERVELARVYFRICSHLASQGLTVILSAVAMYDEVREWVRANIPSAFEVYLRVPEDERRRRDSSGKKVYGQIGAQRDLYDEPKSPDLVLDNFGQTDPHYAARTVCERYLAKPRQIADLGRRDHWKRYYAEHGGVHDPSSFAQQVAAQLSPGSALLEIGCGNGRDAAYFASRGLRVAALDRSEAAIERARATHSAEGIRFEAGSLGEVATRLTPPFDFAYSRFVLHAMTLPEELEVLRVTAELLRSGGRFFIECRSILDPLSRQGEVLSPTERIHGHYRRFIIADELCERLLAAGFRVVDLVESAGLAALGADDPVVLRLSAEKV